MGQRFLAQSTLRPKTAHIPRQNVPQRSLVSFFHKDDFGSLTLLRRPLLSYIRLLEFDRGWREFNYRFVPVCRFRQLLAADSSLIPPYVGSILQGSSFAGDCSSIILAASMTFQRGLAV